MRALTPAARRFVVALVELGGKNQTEAAALAGYTGNDKARAVTASRLCSDPRVQEALMEQAKALMKSSALSATATAIQIMEDPMAGAKDRLAAVKLVLSFAGMEQAAQTVNHNISVTTGEQIEQVKRLADELGLDPKKLLGKAGVTIDAEYTEVDTPTQPTEDWETDWQE